jgi:ATP-dependent exoDNAse (exonuclease V) beta subunit
LQESEAEDGQVVSAVLPPPHDVVAMDGQEAPAIEMLEHDWRARHFELDTSLRALLQERLEKYRLSPTHVTNFVDLEHGGPQAFMLQTLLDFPTAPNPDACYGSAMHATLQWIQQQVNRNTSMPPLQSVQEQFSEQLGSVQLYGEQQAIYEARGYDALQSFLASEAFKFTPGNQPEYSFWREGELQDGDIRLAGKIDLLQVDEPNKQLSIVDYKTGSALTSPAKLHRYELQLYGYKLLLMASRQFRGYHIDTGQLVFLEPGLNQGKVIIKHIDFTDTELERMRQLNLAIWNRIQTLSIPSIAAYGESVTAMRKFEQDLIDGNV